MPSQPNAPKHDPRQVLHQKYGFDFPPSFFAFWDFMQSLPEAETNRDRTYLNTIDFGLAPVFKVFDPDLDIEAFDPITEGRYYSDPPEFFTILDGHIDGLHWGYYIDEVPSTPREHLIASYYSSDAFEIACCGYSIFEILRQSLELNYGDALYELNIAQKDLKSEARKRLDRLDRFRRLLLPWGTGDRPEVGSEYDDRYRIQRDTTAPTRDRMGIIVPPELFRPFHGEESLEIWNYIPTEPEVAAFREDALQALAEGYPGTALKLGKDLWIYHHFNEVSCELLNKAYEVLGRELQRQMLIKYRQDRSADQIKELQQALQNPAAYPALRLGNLHIRTLPPEISLLQHTEYLDLTRNALTDLPPEFSALQGLRRLDLADNNLKSIPAPLFEMRQLSELNIAGNPIAQAPADIARLSGLITLRLGSPVMQEFPAAVCQIEGLQALHLIECRFERIAPDISQLQSLKALHVVKGRLASLPPESGHLSSLEELHIENIGADPIIPPEVQNLEALHSLSFTIIMQHVFDHEMVFPEAFCSLKNLRELKLSTNQKLVLPSDFTHLASLETLDIDSHQLGTIPAQVFALTQLKKLSLSMAGLTALPPEIANLDQLESLNLYGNRIQHIPVEMASLSRLKEINLAANRLPSVEIDRLKAMFPNAEMSLYSQHQD